MKHIAPIVLFFLCSTNLFGQHLSVSISDDFKVIEGLNKNQTVTHSIYYNNNFYTVTNSAAGGNKWLFTRLYDVAYAVTLSRFDKDMKPVGQAELESGKKNFGPLTPSMLCFNNKLYLAYFKTSNKTSFSLYLARVDENSLSLSEPSSICTIQQENVGLSGMMSVIAGGLVYFAISPDNTRLLTVCKSGPNKVQTIVLDQDLHVLNQATVSVNLTSFDIPSAVLTNDNGACLVLSSDEGVRILGIASDGHKTESRYSPAGSLTANNAHVQLAKDGKSIFVYGTFNYSAHPSEFWCHGFMVARVDAKTFKISAPATYGFDEAFLQPLVEKGGGIKNKKIYSMYNIVPQMLEMDNGNIALIGSAEITTEEFSQSAPDMNNRYHTKATTTLKVGPVVVLFPDLKGKAFDHVIIPRQIELYKSASSGSQPIHIVSAPGISNVPAEFIAKPLGSEIVIIYNDNLENLSASADAKVKVSKKTGDLELAEAFINKEKKLEYRKVVNETNKVRATYYLGDAISTNSPEIVFPIGKEGQGFNALKTYFTNWCFLEIK
jgi:hypothetical protein